MTAQPAFEDAQRTADIDYTGDATMEVWFDDLLGVFEKHDCKVEGASDGPTEDSWYERLEALRAAVHDAERAILGDGTNEADQRLHEALAPLWRAAR